LSQLLPEQNWPNSLKYRSVQEMALPEDPPIGQRHLLPASSLLLPDGQMTRKGQSRKRSVVPTI